LSTLLRRLAIVVGVAVSGFAFSLTSAGQAVAQNVKPLLVQVMNGSDNPVPVIGTVQVANTAAAPVVARDLGDFSARSAFNEQRRVDVTGFARADFTIPPGKRLAKEASPITILLNWKPRR
jgi:hypothetical protein